MPRNVKIAYGKSFIELALDPALAEWHVFEPKFTSALPDARRAFLEACRNPIGSAPLSEMIRPADRVVIATADHTRPVPNRLLIPWLLEAMAVPPENVTVLVGTGTHRPPTSAELEDMFGGELLRTLRVISHDAFNPEENRALGTTPSGINVSLNRHYAAADKRIALGFIEPHFFAGFSGGAKAVAPGLASLESIFALHSYQFISDPASTWGEIDCNPIQRAVHEVTALCPPDFLVNVTLNRDKAITGVYAGDYRHAHREGCARVREETMIPVDRAFPVVITSNSGYPLDQNLYQTVKGISAADRIAQPGGVILTISECRDGIPEGGNFRALLERGSSLAAFERYLTAQSVPVLDQWQAQILLKIIDAKRAYLYSTIPSDSVRACRLYPADSVESALDGLFDAMGRGVPAAVLPAGPLTIPYLR